jgi:hypothetical protein
MSFECTPACWKRNEEILAELSADTRGDIGEGA